MSPHASAGRAGPADVPSVPGDEYRAALARWPSGVTVVTARGANDEPVGMTASSFTSLSLEPPLTLLCVAQGARSHDALVSAPGVAVHVLSEDQADVSRAFARPGADKFEGIARARGRFDVPLLPLGVARLVCARHAVHEEGDHTILVARVLETEVTEAPALVYADRGYHGLRSP